MRYIKKSCCWLVAISSVMMVSACSVKLPSINKYNITNFQQPVTNQRARTQLSLLITTPTADPGYQSNRMKYVKTPYQLQSFADNRWIAPPANLILPLIEQAVNNRHYFHAVVTPPFSGKVDFRLDTKILVLQQEFILPQSQIRFIVKSSIINSKTNRVVATRTYKIVVPNVPNTPYGGVLATSHAANRIAKQIALFAVRNAR